MSTEHIITTVLEVFAIAFAVYLIAAEDRIAAFERRVFNAVRRAVRRRAAVKRTAQASKNMHPALRVAVDNTHGLVCEREMQKRVFRAG